MTSAPRSISGLDWRGRPIDVAIADGIISSVVPSTSAPRRTLLPALHDHHVHLYAAAARLDSVDASGCASRGAFLELVRTAADRASAVRVVGYDETVVGPLDRDTLDALADSGVAIRVQHRGGHLWILNTTACARLATSVNVPDDGCFWDRDHDVVDGSAPPVDVMRVVTRLQSRGVVGVDDLTPTLSPRAADDLRNRLRHDLDVRVFGATTSTATRRAGDGVKVVLPDHTLLLPDEVVAKVDHARPAAIAFHCATAETMAILLASAESIRASDRIEHAFLAPREVPGLWAARRKDAPTIGVHPGFLRTHGDRHHRHASPGDLSDYLRVRTWADAGLTLLGGTDLPFSVEDPWTAMQAAVDRQANSGAVLSPDEAISPEAAFSLFRRGGWRGGRPRLDLEPGTTADICVIRGTWHDARRDLSGVDVLVTFRAGDEVFRSS
ncbi:MAG: amidohydrolase family protein [Rhodoglobus sp.]